MAEGRAADGAAWIDVGCGGGAGREGDRPLLEALSAALPDETVEAAIAATGTRERRRRRPTRLVVTLVAAMGLRAAESVRHAPAGVVDGLRDGGVGERSGWRLPDRRPRRNPRAVKRKMSKYLLKPPPPVPPPADRATPTIPSIRILQP